MNSNKTARQLLFLNAVMLKLTLKIYGFNDYAALIFQNSWKVLDSVLCLQLKVFTCIFFLYNVSHYNGVSHLKLDFHMKC